MANPAIEPTDAVDQTREDMMKGVGAVITEIIEKFTSQLREVRGDLSEIAVASAMKDQAKAMWAKFVNFAGDTSTGAKNYVQCFNELGRLAQAAPGEILAALAAGAH
jgi:hypothetical protein